MSQSKKNKLKVAELKQLEPLADVYEFKKFNRYLVICDKPSLILDSTGRNSRQESVDKMVKQLDLMGIPAVGIFLDEKNEIKILELKGGSDG